MLTFSIRILFPKTTCCIFCFTELKIRDSSFGLEQLCEQLSPRALGPSCNHCLFFICSFLPKDEVPEFLLADLAEQQGTVPPCQRDSVSQVTSFSKGDPWMHWVQEVLRDQQGQVKRRAGNEW